MQKEKKRKKRKKKEGEGEGKGGEREEVNLAKEVPQRKNQLKLRESRKSSWKR